VADVMNVLRNSELIESCFTERSTVKCCRSNAIFFFFFFLSLTAPAVSAAVGEGANIRAHVRTKTNYDNPSFRAT